MRKEGEAETAKCEKYCEWGKPKTGNHEVISTVRFLESPLAIFANSSGYHGRLIELILL
jgi:hypothetical protein